MRILNIIISFFLLLTIQVFAQNNPIVSYDFEKNIKNKEIDNKHFKSLINKIKGIKVNGTDFSSSSIKLVPNISVINEYEDGHDYKLKVVKLEVTLSSENKFDKQVFNQYSTKLIGTGENVDIAIGKAISSLKISDPKLKKFFEESNTEIINYYKEKCNSLISNAKTSIDRKEYLNAYRILSGIPSFASCYKNSESMISNIYLNIREEKCEFIVKQAKIEEAKGNYILALEILENLDSKSKCYKAEFDNLVSKISKNIKAEEMNMFNERKNEFEKLSDIEKIRILAEKADRLNINLNIN